MSEKVTDLLKCFFDVLTMSRFESGFFDAILTNHVLPRGFYFDQLGANTCLISRGGVLRMRRFFG